MNDSLVIEMQRYGFTQREAKVYVTVLEMGSSIASMISKRTGLKRTSVYEILEALKQKGAMMESLKDNVKTYSSVSPELLLSGFEQRAEGFRKILPELMLLAGKWGNRPTIEYFEGFEGLKRSFEYVLQKGAESGEPFYSFMGTGIEMDPRFSRYLQEEFGPKRLECPLKTKVIISSKNKTEYLEFNQKTHESLVIDDEIFDMGNEIVLFGHDKTAILMYSKDEMSGLVIGSKTLHEGLKSMFRLIWRKIRGS